MKKLWIRILSDYGQACYKHSYIDLAEEYNTTEMGIGKAIAAIERRAAMCGTVEYADGSLRVLKTKTQKRRSKPRRKKRACGCH
jgi:hypothetical protein